MAHVLPGQPSCPNCGARATPHAKACEDCGYRFFEDSLPADRISGAIRAKRSRVRALVLTAGAVAAVGSTASLITRDGPVAGDGRLGPRGAVQRTAISLDVLAGHPLSTGAAERRLEARFASRRDDDGAAARCSALRPRPAHAIRRCRIHYPGGTIRTVILLTNPQGQEVLVKP